MVEIFEFIMSKPLEFLAGLGISASTIYTIIAIIKGFINLFTKKSKTKKLKEFQEKLVEMIIEKLSNCENYIDKISTGVINKITTSEAYISIQDELIKLSTSDTCPVELKAYIQTILDQSGNEDLKLLYNQIKQSITNEVSSAVSTIIVNGSQVTEEVSNNNIEENNNSQEKIELDSKTTTSGEISYD